MGTCPSTLFRRLLAMQAGRGLSCHRGVPALQIPPMAGVFPWGGYGTQQGAGGKAHDVTAR